LRSDRMQPCTHQDPSKCFSYLSQKAPKLPKMSAARGYLQPGDAAPDFAAKAAIRKDNDIAEIDIKLSDFKGKYLVLFFYPQDFTFVCPTEIIAFSDRVEEFRSIGCEVVAASTDSANCHRAWMKTPRTDGGLGDINLPLLADPTHAISKAYQVYQEEGGVAFRGLFIIDGKGVLRQITVNDLPVGRDVDETLRLIQAFKFTDEHGEVCPANWRPGKKTMKPNHAGISKYLTESNGV